MPTNRKSSDEPTTTPVPVWARVAAATFAAIFFGFGIYFTLYPTAAISFFDKDSGFATSGVAALQSGNRAVELFILLYAVRDVFMAMVISAAALYDTEDGRTLAWALIAGGFTASSDGFIAKATVGIGQWDHWGYAPLLLGVGSYLLMKRA